MFKYKNSLNQTTTGLSKTYVIENSAAITVGNAVQLDGGFVQPAVSTGAILGVVVSIQNEDGTPVTHNGLGGAFSGTYTAAANNETVAKVSVIVDVDPNTVYSAALDAAPGTTTGSDLAGATFNVLNATTLDESTVTTPGTQFKSLGLDKDDTSRVLVKMLTAEFGGVVNITINNN